MCRVSVKECTKCGEVKSLSDFHKAKNCKDGHQSRCKSCANKNALANYHENREARLTNKRANAAKHRTRNSKAQRERQIRYRQQVMEHYCDGEPYCKGCGVMNIEVLTIDHIDENGAKHRKQEPAQRCFGWWIRNGFPEGYQILCWNCNNAKHRHHKVPIYKYKDGFEPSVQYPKEK